MSGDERDSALAVAELKGDLKALEERMRTMQAEYEGALDRFRADYQSSFRQQLIAIAGLIGLGFVALGFFLAQQSGTAPAPIIIQTAPVPAPEPAPAEVRTAQEAPAPVPGP